MPNIQYHNALTNAIVRRDNQVNMLTHSYKENHSWIEPPKGLKPSLYIQQWLVISCYASSFSCTGSSSTILQVTYRGFIVSIAARIIAPVATSGVT